MLNISLKEFIIRLSYVAVSRVRKFNGLLFEESFDYQQFSRATGTAQSRDTTLTYRKADAERRSKQPLR